VILNGKVGCNIVDWDIANIFALSSERIGIKNGERSKMCSRTRVKLSCRGCAYAWENKEEPSDAEQCQTCIRNPNPPQIPSTDNYEHFEKPMKLLGKVLDD